MAERTRHKTGMLAETLACIFLFLKNYRIVERRCRTPLGEIDILAAKGDTLVLVEVKYRSTITAALESITPHQQQRLIRAADYIAARYPRYNTRRWDIIALAPRSWPHHVVNAWSGN